jgi:ABC-type multidrug transport system fused ATPase/permease subunit
MKKKGMYYNLVRTQTTNHEMEDEDESETGTDSNHSTNENNTYSSTEVPQCRFRNVHFSYPTRPDSTVFRGLNLTVRKGETLALVGESGGGKVGYCGFNKSDLHW